MLEGWAGRLCPAGYGEDIQGRRFLVAEEEDEVIGFCVLNPETGSPRALYVAPEHGGRGVGRGSPRRKPSSATPALPNST